jgi:hypothetical protein
MTPCAAPHRPRVPRVGGIGGALYEAVREYLGRKGAKGLFMFRPTTRLWCTMPRSCPATASD